MVVVRMVRVRNMTVEETADIQGRSPNWVRNWLRRFDDGGLQGLRDLPRCGRPRRIPRDVIDGIIAKASCCKNHTLGVAAEDTQGHGRKTSHHVRQENHAPAQPVSEGTTKGPRQSGQQEGRAELEISLQQAGFTPRKGWFHRINGGRGNFHTRRDSRLQILVPGGPFP